MVGTRKQIDFAKKILRGAGFFLAHKIMTEPVYKDYYKQRLMVLKAIEAIEAGQNEDFMRMKDLLPRWFNLIVESSSEGIVPSVNAEKIIGVFKDEFVLGKMRALIDQDGNPITQLPPIDSVLEDQLPEVKELLEDLDVANDAL